MTKLKKKPRSIADTSTGLFDVIGASSVPVPVAGTLLTSAVSELITAGLESGNGTRVLLHLPRETEEAIHQRINLDNNLSSGEFYALSVGSDRQIVCRPVGKLPRSSRMRREYFAMLVEAGSVTTIAAKVAPKSSSLWETCFTDSADLAARCLSVLSTGLESRHRDTAAIFSEVEKLINGDTQRAKISSFQKLLTLILSEIRNTVEPRSKKLEHELRWTRTLNLIQSAVGWELDSEKLNTMIARVMKQSVGFDYLELQILHLNDQKVEITSSFQDNSTSMGGALLTVILRPEKLEELLKGHKPVVLNAENAGRYLMNPRLMTMMELESGALIPLNYQRRPNGLLKLFSNHPNHYNSAEITRLDKIGKIIARSLENARIHALMHRMATMDGLTNVYNHRFFAEHIVREFKRAQRYKGKLSLLMLDIDYFKQYNDNNGHLQGDAVLTVVGSLLKKNVREVDIVCRYGGEEFVVILPETEIEQAVVVAEKIRFAIEEYPFKFEHRQPNGKVTVSIGLIEGVEGIESSSELINRADLALYRAKRMGRNRCEIF